MTREEILEAAVQIFSQKGYHATSMQEIARAVHLQKASLYHHISSKQDILVDLLDQSLDQLIDLLQSVVKQDLSADEKLKLAVISYMGMLLENREKASVLLLEHRSLSPEYLSRHVPRRDKFESLWIEIIQQGCYQNVFECGDPILAARLLLGMMNWTITWYRTDGALTSRQISEKIAATFIFGLLVRDDTSDRL